MPINEYQEGAAHAAPPFKQRIPSPYAGMNTVRGPHEIDEKEMADCVNFWISPYGRFGTRWGTKQMMPVPLSTSGLGEKQYPVTKSTTGTDLLKIQAVDYLPSSDVYIVVAGRKIFAVPRESYWGLASGWTWGEWGTKATKTVMEAIPDGVSSPTTRYYMEDKGAWYSSTDDGTTLTTVSNPATLPCAVSVPGGRALYIGDTNALTDDDPVSTTLFYGSLYIASGGALQYLYTVTAAMLTDDPHTPEDRAAGDIYVDTLAAAALSNPAPDAAGCLTIRGNRLWVSERDGSKVWFSGVDDSRDWGWDGTGTDPSFTGGSFNVDKDDGGVLNGQCNFKDRLVLFKFDRNGVRNTIHKVTGSMSGTEGDYFRREQMAEGLSAIDARCVCPSGDDVLFAGAGGVYALQLVDALGNVGSIPQSLKINSILDSDRPRHMAYSPRYGIAFVVCTSGQTLMFHRGVEGWFRFSFASFIPDCVVCLGDSVFFGSRAGQLYMLDSSVEQDGVYSDGSGGAEFSKAFLTRVYDFGQPLYRAFLEKFMLAMSVRSAGKVYLDVRTEYGSNYERTIPFEGEAEVPIGWDSALSVWDSSACGWDRSGVAMMQAKVSKIGDNFQLRIASTAAVDVLDMFAYGVYTTDKRWRW